MADLFDRSHTTPVDAPRPLADRLRPASLGEVIGQDHILGPDAPLGAMLKAGRLTSVILWGPPGVGKTTIARLLADATDLAFVQISAIFSGTESAARRSASPNAHARCKGVSGGPWQLMLTGTTGRSNSGVRKWSGTAMP